MGVVGATPDCELGPENDSRTTNSTGLRQSATRVLSDRDTFESVFSVMSGLASRVAAVNALLGAISQAAASRPITEARGGWPRNLQLHR